MSVFCYSEKVSRFGVILGLMVKVWMGEGNDLVGYGFVYVIFLLFVGIFKIVLILVIIMLMRFFYYELDVIFFFWYVF